MYKTSCAFLFALTLTVAPAFARCACEGPQTPVEEFAQKAVSAARKMPSESDRTIARNFRMQGLLEDASQYYRSAATKAASEVEAARANVNSAAEVEQIALHSAAVHREAAAFFSQKGDAATAAQNWESAINDELAAHKMNNDLATEYGTVGRLYEQAHQINKAAEMFKKQADTLSANHGRYDAGTQFALSEYNRLSRLAKNQ
jgi:tetratricopeptide (TPR) repeat protein